jgi:hypothetical protein
MEYWRVGRNPLIHYSSTQMPYLFAGAALLCASSFKIE